LEKLIYFICTSYLDLLVRNDCDSLFLVRSISLIIYLCRGIPTTAYSVVLYFHYSCLPCLPTLIKRIHHLHFSNLTGSNTWRLTIILSCISSTYVSFFLIRLTWSRRWTACCPPRRTKVKVKVNG